MAELTPLTEAELNQIELATCYEARAGEHGWAVTKRVSVLCKRLIAEARAQRERERHMENISDALDQMRANAGFP